MSGALGEEVALNDDHVKSDDDEPRARLGWRLAAIVAVTGAAAAAVVFFASNDAGPLDDSWTEGALGRAPEFRLSNLRYPDGVVALTDRGGRPAVINFWASWCVPCRREMPALEAAHLRHRDQVTFIGVNHQDGRDVAQEFVEQTGVSYPSGYDPDGAVARRYALFGLPTTILVTADGEIVAKRTGEVTTAGLDEMIERHFDGGR